MSVELKELLGSKYQELSPYCEDILIDIVLNKENKLNGRNIKYAYFEYPTILRRHMVPNTKERQALKFLLGQELVYIDEASGFAPACAGPTEKGSKLAHALMEEIRKRWGTQ